MDLTHTGRKYASTRAGMEAFKIDQLRCEKWLYYAGSAAGRKVTSVFAGGMFSLLLTCSVAMVDDFS
jgi:hypothetical protein